MNFENMPVGPTPEQLKQQEEMAQYAQWMQDHPEKVIAPEDLRESGPEVAEFEKMIDLFRSEYPLAKLYSIIDLTPEKAPHHPLREPARVALNPIVAKLNILKKETNISEEKYEELKAQYRNISRAVGVINKNKVHHDR